MLLAELEAPFRGALLIADMTFRDQIPPWASDEEQVTAAATALAVRIQHEVDGAARVYVWDGSENPEGILAFSGAVRVDSGHLWVGDMEQRRGVTVECPPGLVQVTVLLAEPRWSPRIDLVISGGG